VILPLKVGQGRADDVILTGRSIDAEEARAMGLVDEVAEDPGAAVEAWAARELAPKSGAALRWAVRTARYQFNEAIERTLPAVEKLYLEQLMATHDANEGLAAFLEKRKPEWTHR
jgi:cyclohexa-1,5-dienecarbonyl-CoA hydratase